MSKRNIKLTIEYDGTDYEGWQTQSSGRGIQDIIEAGVARVLGETVKIVGAGRTDAGVHARGQVANFFTNSEMDAYRMRWSINAVLPKAIAVREVEDAPFDFDARRGAKSRTYAYYIWNEKYASPFFRRYSWWISRQLEIFLMNQAAEHLLGEHDFSAFTTEKYKSAVRTLTALEVEELADYPGRMLRMTFKADSFLHHLVRMIVGTLVAVGLGNILVERVGEILSAGDVRAAGPKAPAKGLILERVDY